VAGDVQPQRPAGLVGLGRGSVIYDFGERLTFSKARRQDSDIETLRLMFPTCASVVKTGEAEDRAGTDYVISLRRGARLCVDAKARDKGCRRFWKAGPEVALEVWSVRPGGKYQVPASRARTGWTLDESKEIDLILFTFDAADHAFAYVRPLPLLRETFRRNYGDWKAQCRSDVQDSRSWQSECMFVPLVKVDEAIEAMSRNKVS
jgi:hypothetical protein